MRYAVIGKSLPHTISPRLHNMLGNLSYGVKEFEDEAALRRFVESRECVGYNVTIPYKQAVMPLLDEIDEEAKAIAKEKGVEFEDRHKKGDILSLFFEEFAEEHMIQPTFVMDHPIEISPLTKKKPENPDYVERFEFFVNGWEMANAYSELNDPIDQRERFKAQEEALAQGDEEANTTDEDFLNALEIGMAPTGGIGYGIDRMVMLLTDSAAIRDVLLFPTMKSLDK